MTIYTTRQRQLRHQNRVLQRSRTRCNVVASSLVLLMAVWAVRCTHAFIRTNLRLLSPHAWTLRQQASSSSARLASEVVAANGAFAGPMNGEVVNNNHANNKSKMETIGSNNNNINNIRLSVSEKARTVTAVSTSGTLCTVSAHDGIQGAPFGSFVDYVLDDHGNPVLLMNSMSMHTMNVEQMEAASGQPALVTLFTQLGGGGQNRNTNWSRPSSSSSSAGGGASKTLQDVSRCSLTGYLVKMKRTDADMDAIRMRYSLTHAYADQVMDSPKFAFYRLQPAKIYFVGGFGVLAKWIDPTDYQAAAPDILAKDAADIVERCNRDHDTDLILTAQHMLTVTAPILQVRMTNVDRLGMDLRVTYQQGTRRNKVQTDEFRIGFRIPVLSTEDAKSEILKVFQEAWEKGNGITWGDDESEMLGSTVPFVKIAADSLE